MPRNVDESRSGTFPRLTARLRRWGLVRALGLAAALTIAARTIGLIWHEPLPFMSEGGDLAYDFALAYVTGLIFNWLVVERPRERDLDKVYRVIGPSIQSLGGVPRKIAQTLGPLAHATASSPPTEEEWKAICASVRPNSPTGVLTYQGGGPGALSAIAFVMSELERADGFRERIIPTLHYLPAELVSMLADEQQATLRRMLTLMRDQAMPLRPQPLGDGMASALADYTDRCTALNEYFETHVRRRMEK